MKSNKPKNQILGMINQSIKSNSEYDSEENVKLREKTKGARRRLFSGRTVESNNAYTPIDHSFKLSDSKTNTREIDRVETLLNRMKTIKDNKGSFYVLDFETLGDFKGDNTTKLDLFAVTEAAMSKLDYVDGPNGRELVSSVAHNITSGLGEGANLKYSRIKNMPEFDSTLKSTIQRIASHHNKSGFVGGNIASIDSNVSILDSKAFTEGIKNLTNRSLVKLEYGSKEWATETLKMIDTINNISKDNGVFVTMNGTQFDIPVLEKISRKAYEVLGVTDIDSKIETLNKSIQNSHLDFQLEQRNYIGGDILKVLSEAGASDEILKGNSFKVENQYKGLFHEQHNAHVAVQDTEASGKIVDRMMSSLVQYFNEEKPKNIYNIGLNSGSLLYANQALPSKAGSLDTRFISGNIAYGNSYLSYSGGIYEVADLRQLTVNKENFPILNTKDSKMNTPIGKSDAESLSLFEGKNPFVLTLNDKVKGEQIHIVRDSLEEIQRDVFDGDFFSPLDKNHITGSTIFRQNKSIRGDNARRDFDQLFDVNSDSKGFRRAEMMLNVHEKAIGNFDAYEVMSDGKVSSKKTSLKLNYEALVELSKSAQITDISVDGDYRIATEIIDSVSGDASTKTYSINPKQFIGEFNTFKKFNKVNDSIDVRINPETIDSYFSMYHKMDREYSSLKKFVNDINKKVFEEYGTLDTFAKSNGVDSKSASQILNQIKTQMLKDSYEEMNSIVQNHIVEKQKERFIKDPSKDTFDVIENSNTGEKTYIPKEKVINASIGMTNKPITISDLYAIDVVGRDGDYTRLNSKTKGGFSGRLKSLMYGITDKKDSVLQEQKRFEYIMSVADDLVNRGIIGQDSYDIYAKSSRGATNIADSLGREMSSYLKSYHSNIEKQGFVVTDIASVNNDIKPVKEAYIDKFLKKRILINDINNPRNTFKIFKDAIGKGVSSSDVIRDIVNRSFDKNHISFFGGSSVRVRSKEGDNITESKLYSNIKNVLKEELNWNDNHIESYMDAIRGYVSDDRVKGANEGNDGYTFYLTKDKDTGDIKSVIAPKKDSKKVLRGLADFTNEELKEMAMVDILPKFKDKDGVKSIIQGTIEKANYQKITAYNGKNGFKFYSGDVVSQYINSFRNKVKNVTDHVNSKDMRVANSIIGSSSKPINEGAMLTSNVFRYKYDDNGNPIKQNGIYVREKLVSVNANDFLSDKVVDASNLLYDIEDVISGTNPNTKQISEELYDSLVNIYGNNESSKGEIENEISRIRNIRNYTQKTLDDFDFESADPRLKAWYDLNIRKIASVVASNMTVDKYNQGTYDLLTRISQNGSSLMKEKAASSGLIRIDSAEDYKFQARYNNTARPLYDQDLSPKPVSSQDQITEARRLGSTKLFSTNTSHDNVSSVLDFKIGTSLNSIHASDIDNAADVIGRNYDYQGITTSATRMSPDVLIKRMQRMSVDKDLAEKIIENTNKKYGKKYGMNTYDDIMKSFMAIGGTYEDAAFIEPTAARVMFGPRTETTISVDEEHLKKYSVGSIIHNGDTLINSDGRHIRHDRVDVKVTGHDFKNNKLLVIKNDDLGDIKLIQASGEKMMASAPKIIKGQEELAREMFLTLTGGSNVATFSSYGKHGSVGDVFAGYYQALLRNVKNESDASKLQGMFDKHLAGEQLKVNFNKRNNRWEIIDGGSSAEGYDVFAAMKNLREDIFSSEDEFFKNSSLSIKELEMISEDFDANDPLGNNTANKFYVDFKVGQDADFNGRKINISARNNLSTGIVDNKYYEDGSYDRILRPYLDNLEELIKNNPDSKDMAKQANYVKSILDITSGEKSSNLVIKDIDLSDIKGLNGELSAIDLPEIFKYGAKNEYGKEINAYRIKLNDMAFSNSLITNDASMSAMNVSDTVEEILIPAMKANKLGEQAFLTSSQKAASDLLKPIVSLLNNDFKDDTTINDINNTISYRYKSYMTSLVNEITSKDGLAYKSFEAQVPISARVRFSKILTPELMEDGSYLDKSIPEAFSNGKHYVAGRYSLDTLEDAGANFEKIGKQLVEEIGYNPTEDLSNLKGKKLHEAVAKDYFLNQSIPVAVNRDPNILTRSKVISKLKADKSLMGEQFVTDAVSALDMNADSDGDNANLDFSSAIDENGKLRVNGDAILDSANEQWERQSDHTTNEGIHNAVNRWNKVKAGESSAHTIEGIEQSIINGPDGERFSKNFSYTKDENKNFLAVIQRLSKSEIGVTSNQNFYLRAASEKYFTSKENKTYQNLFYNITQDFEQKVIDVKLLKSVEDASEVLQNGSRYRSALSKLSNSKNNTSTAEALNEIYRLGVNIKVLDPMLEAKSEAEVNKAISRIMSGSITKGDKTETFLYTLNNIFKDEDARKSFNSDLLRFKQRSTVDIDGVVGLLKSISNAETDVERGKEVAELVRGKLDIFDSDHRVNDVQFLNKQNEHVLAEGDVIQSNGKGESNGFYEVKKVSTGDDGKVTVDYKTIGGDEAIKSFTRDSAYEASEFLTDNFDRHGSYTERLGVKRVSVDEVIKMRQEAVFNRSKEISKEASKNIDSFNYHSDIKNKVKGNLSFDGSSYGLADLNGAFSNELKEDLTITRKLRDSGNLKAINHNEESYLKQMNDAIRNRASNVTHGEARRDFIVNSLAKKIGLNNAGYDSFVSSLDGKIVDVGNSLKQKAEAVQFYNQKEYIEELNNVENKIRNSNLTEVEKNNLHSTMVDKEVSNVIKLNDNAKAELSSIYKEILSNKDWANKILNINADKVDAMIGQGYNSNVINYVKNSKITFGKHIGLSVGDLSMIDLQTILNVQSNEDNILQTQRMIGHYINSINLEAEAGNTIKVPSVSKILGISPSKEYIEERNKIFSSTESMNNAIIEAAKETKVKETVSNVDEEISKSITKSGLLKNKKARMIAGAAMAVLATSYVLGSSFNENSKSSLRADSRNNGTGSPSPNGNYDERPLPLTAPTSDNSIHMQPGYGISYKVKGLVDSGQSNNVANTITSGFQSEYGPNLQVRTQTSDRTREVNRKWVEDKMEDVVY